MIKYKKTFLNKMKSLLHYFVEFFNHSSILSKAYLDNCVVRKLDQKSIIIITNNKNIFSANDSC